jgi:hypothetical protein
VEEAKTGNWIGIKGETSYEMKTPLELFYTRYLTNTYHTASVNRCWIYPLTIVVPERCLEPHGDALLRDTLEELFEASRCDHSHLLAQVRRAILFISLSLHHQ